MRADAKECVVAIVKSPAWVSYIWFGMTVGVSVLAKPVMTSAAALSGPAALDVGRVVNEALNRAEFVTLIILLILVRMSENLREFLLPTAALALILIAQSVWLLPAIATHSGLIVAGIGPDSSIANSVYSVLEVTKLIVLIYLGFRSLQILTNSQQFRE